MQESAAKAAMKSGDCFPPKAYQNRQPKQQRWVVKFIIKTYVKRHGFFFLLLAKGKVAVFAATCLQSGRLVPLFGGGF
jgi:hypothetical protein